MAARPRKTTEKGVKRPTAGARSKAHDKIAEGLNEVVKSLRPKPNSELAEFSLAYERLAIQLGFEINNFDGCPMDHAAALYTVFAALCAQMHLPVALIFHDINDMAQRGELKAYMQNHAITCSRNPGP